MSIRSLIGLLLFTAFGWLFILGPGVLNQRSVSDHAAEYLSAEFEVTGSNCIGGQSGFDAHGRRTSTASRYCFLEGLVFVEEGGPGVAEEISIGGDLSDDQPPGSRMRVFYNPNPDLPAFGVNYLNRRTIPAYDYDAEDPGGTAERWIVEAGKFVLLALAMVVLTFVLLRWGIWRMQKSSHSTWRLDLGGGSPVPGTFCFSQGLTFLVMQFPSPTIAGSILGLIGLGVGAALLMRRFVSYSLDDRTEIHGRHLFALALPKKKQRKAVYEHGRIAVTGGELEIRLVGSNEGLTIPCGKDEKATLALADSIRRQLKIPFATSSEVLDEWHGLQEQRAQGKRSGALRTLTRIFSVVALVIALAASAFLAVEKLAEVRIGAIRTVLEPSSMIRQWTPLRRFILSRVPPDSGEQEQLELLRLLNAIDHERFPEIAMDLAWALDRSTGVESPLEGDSPPATGDINRRLARHLGRELDANGGVFSWFALDERFLDDIEAVAAEDPMAAWRVWEHFAVGLLNNPEEFLYAVGPALADRRPIHFAIKRGSFHGLGAVLNFEGQPEPIEKHPDVIAHTVGEAMALQYWNYQGVGSDTFPASFADWWQQWAHDHHLPPF